MKPFQLPGPRGPEGTHPRGPVAPPRARCPVDRLRGFALAPAFAFAFALGGCGDGESPATRGGIPANPFLGDGGLAGLQLEEEVEIDLTGDGTPEVVVVSVSGEDARSLEIDFQVSRPSGEVLYAAEWSSVDYPEVRRSLDEDVPAWVVTQAVRERLEDLFGADAVQPLLPEEIDPARLHLALQFEAWREERGLPALVPLTPEEAAEAGRIPLADAQVREIAAELPGRPALSYVAGDVFRTVVWSPGLQRFVTVYACC